MLALVAGGGAALGCNTRYEATADRATAEPPLLGAGRGSTSASAVPEKAAAEPTTSAEAQPSPETRPSGTAVSSAAPSAAPVDAPRHHRRRRAPRAAETDAPSTGDAELKVSRLVTARGVSGREPTGAATSFHAAGLERVYAFVEITNDARAESEVVVAFSPPGGGPAHRVKLVVGAEPRWRTWAVTKRARTPGSWAVIVSTTSGRELARKAFEITP